MSHQGRGRGSGTNPDFLWVNRTPDSDRLSATRQERNEVRTITTHARQWRAALRRQQRLYSAQTEATHAQSIVGWGRQALSETSSGGASAAPSPTAMTQTIGNSIESFNYLDSPDDTWWSYNAFQYAVDSWLPSVFQDLKVLDESLPVSEACLSTIDRIIRGCLENRMHMYSLLAASSGFKKFVLNLQLDRHDTPEYCMSRALQHLRHHLAEGEPQLDESLIFDLKALSTFEGYVNNLEGAKLHFSMVQHLVQSIGGFDILEPPMRHLCWLWDLLVAGATGETPLMPLSWDPGSLSQLRMEEEILLGLAQNRIVPNGAGLLDYQTMVHQGLTKIIRDTVQWFQVLQYSHTQNPNSSSIEQWTTRRSHALIHRLLSLSLRSPGEGVQSTLSESIKQSILIVIADTEAARRSRADTNSIRDPTTLPWSNTDRLHHAISDLIQAEEDWQAQHGEVILWMACLGVQQKTVPFIGTVVRQPPPLAVSEDKSYDWFLELARHTFFDQQRREGHPAHPATTDELVQIMSRYPHRCKPSGQPDIDGLEEVLAPCWRYPGAC